MFEIIDHTADIGIAAYGRDIKEAFANSAYAMFSLMARIDAIEEKVSYDIEVTAPDQESLLVAWLNELLYLSDVNHVIFKRFNITNLSESQLRAQAYGEKADPSRHELKTQIKAATYHMLEIKKPSVSPDKSRNSFMVQVIFDT